MQVTIPNLFDLAPAFGVPTLPKLPPVFNMSFQDAALQWMAAKSMNLQVGGGSSSCSSLGWMMLAENPQHANAEPACTACWAFHASHQAVPAAYQPDSGPHAQV
jgi:hypothetical protein